MTESVASLLPPNTTNLDKALEQVAAPALSPVVLRSTYDPEAIPADLLPWLAWGENVPYWPADETQQRDMVARSHKLHGMIGTAAGLRAAARFTGAKVTRIIRPPAITFLGGWTEQARKEWLSAHPQLRLYPKRQRTSAQGFMLNSSFISEHPSKTDAPFRSTSRATLSFPDGSETELSVAEWQIGTAQGNATVSVARKGQSPGLHLGQPVNGYPLKYDAADRLWTLDQQAYSYGTATLKIRTTSPSYKPLSSDVDIVADKAPRPGASLFGVHLGNVHTCKLDSETRYYRRVWLHDPSVAATSRANPAYLGATRLGMPPFHAEVRVQMPARHSASLHAGDYLNTRTPANRHSTNHMTPTLDNLEWMRAESDKILIDTRQRITVRARQTLIAGTVTAGQILDR